MQIFCNFLLFFYFFKTPNLAQYPMNWCKHQYVCLQLLENLQKTCNFFYKSKELLIRKFCLHMSVTIICLYIFFVVTKPHTIYFSINLTPWRNQFIQYGLYVIVKFLLCHGYEKILQTFNSNLVLLHVHHYAFTLAKQFLAEGRRFPWQLSAPPCALILLCCR